MLLFVVNHKEFINIQAISLIFEQELRTERKEIQSFIYIFEVIINYAIDYANAYAINYAIKYAINYTIDYAVKYAINYAIDYAVLNTIDLHL